ncbi:hypothetical protein AC230_11060 [Streptomyces caatingaensis]|uniref:DUF4232 domain-containing protein n=1 Tax=Streptomyces caatingaensis TaxID=1678637 RepID=A0A0K9XGF8_9ACTN|nr:hypothetical protein AC230_11060 [Streptomyces caatingaensis]
MGGAVAAVVLLGVALPTVLHVADEIDSPGPGDRPANAASSRHHSEGPADGRQPGESDDPPGERSRDGSVARGDHRAEPSGDGARTRETGAPQGTDRSGGATVPPPPGATLGAAAPVCSRSQLGGGSGVVGSADAAGRIYGAFRIVNVSHAACAVTGPGSLVASARTGAAGHTRVAVVDHTSGDPAAGLPDPRREPREVVLRPGQAYEVKFAWVPSADGAPGACTKDGSSPTPSSSPATPATTASHAPVLSTAGAPETPAAAGSGGSAGSGSSTGAGGTGGSGGSGGTTGGGITLTNTPMAGEPAAAEARIPEACAGTVYHTGALPASAPTP